MSTAPAFQALFRSDGSSRDNPYSAAVFGQIGRCRTAALGYHRYRCDQSACAQQQTLYHACGNRHCPFCGTLRSRQWIAQRRSELLPTAYYHVVFTVPQQWHGLFLAQRKPMYKALFEAAAQTLLAFGRNSTYLGALPGITMVLHTWGQDLSFHPHVHAIVSGGGMHAKTGRWVQAKRANSRFLFPIAGLRKVFKAKFMAAAAPLHRANGFDVAKVVAQTRQLDWNVYAKAPFGSADAVVEYLGRYTHKIAITRHRIVAVTDTQVRFNYKDYRDGHRTKQMTLSRSEFMRRFELHVLPRRFVKIRHYGYLQNRGKRSRLEGLRTSLRLGSLQPVPQLSSALHALLAYGTNPYRCPHCKQGTLLPIACMYPTNKGTPLPPRC